jgi:hypothetical protein
MRFPPGQEPTDSVIQLHEYSDADLPDVFRIQVLDFLRIAAPPMT